MVGRGVLSSAALWLLVSTTAWSQNCARLKSLRLPGARVTSAAIHPASPARAYDRGLLRLARVLPSHHQGHNVYRFVGAP